MALHELLGIPRGVTAVIGSGGKSSLLHFLARELPGTVLLCTTTHFFPYHDLPLLIDPTKAALHAAFSSARVICAGRPEPISGKLTALPYDLEGIADFVLCEADGSRGLPLKAHASHEPLIPAEAALTVQVVGLSGLGRPIAESAHRAAQFAMLAGCTPDDPATPECTAAVLNRENLPDLYYLNQTDLCAAEAKQLARLLERPCVAGSLREERFECLY